MVATSNLGSWNGHWFLFALDVAICWSIDRSKPYNLGALRIGVATKKKHGCASKKHSVQSPQEQCSKPKWWVKTINQGWGVLLMSLLYICDLFFHQIDLRHSHVTLKTGCRPVLASRCTLKWLRAAPFLQSPRKLEDGRFHEIWWNYGFLLMFFVDGTVVSPKCWQCVEKRVCMNQRFGMAKPDFCWYPLT